MSESALMIVLDVVILLEIALTAGLLWLLFYLYELHPRLKQRFVLWLREVHHYKELLSQFEEGLLTASRVYGQATLKWTVGLKIMASLLQRVSASLYCAR